MVAGGVADRGLSLLAVIYVWRVVEALYLKAPTGRAAEATDPPMMMLIPLWIAALACLWFGFETHVTIGAAQMAAQELLAGSTGMMAGAGDPAAVVGH